MKKKDIIHFESNPLQETDIKRPYSSYTDVLNI